MTNYIKIAAECVQRVNDNGKGRIKARLLFDDEEARFTVFKDDEPFLIAKDAKPTYSWAEYVDHLTDFALAVACAAAATITMEKEVEA